MPDYVAAYLDRSGRGVDPADNGALPFWRAMGTRDLSWEDQARLFRAIDCPLPKRKEAIQPLPKIRVGDEELTLEHAVFDVLTIRPWRRHLRPEVAEWVNKNRHGFKLLRESASKPRFYSPPPNLLTKPPDILIVALLYDVMGVVEASRMLQVVAMLEVDAGQHDLARANLLAVHQFGRHLSQHACVPAVIRGLRMRKSASRCYTVLLDRVVAKPSLESLIEELEGSGRSAKTCLRGVAEQNCCMLIDSVINDLCERYMQREEEAGRDIYEGWKAGKVDPNAALKPLVQMSQLCGVACTLEDRVERRRVWKKICLELSKIDREKMRQEFRDEGAAPAVAYGKEIGAIWVQLLIADYDPVFIAEDTAQSYERMAFTAAKLRLHQLTTGEYPESLDDLTLEEGETLPLDPFTNEPFRYERRGDGFLLYSLGANGEDDDGSDSQGEFVDGEYAPIDWLNERPKPDGPDDLVVRLPIPVLEMPRFE